MKNWLVIPITKEELCKLILITFFILPALVALYLSLEYGFSVAYGVILIFWLFPMMFLFILKEEYDWDFKIKIKFFERDD